MVSGYAKSNDLDIYYEIAGDGFPLLLLMGIGQDSSPWKMHQIPEFKKHFQVIAIDNRDAGKSSKAPSIYTIKDMAEDVIAVLDALDIEKAHIACTQCTQ